MKTILGKLESEHPISLSKAARYISDFASFENNGASEVVSIYLNRASEAFTSLVQLHKDLKHPQSSHKKRRKKSHNETSLRNDEIMDYDDGERKGRSHDENQDKRVDGVLKEEDGSVRVAGIENMGTSQKGKKAPEKRSVKLEDRIRSEDGGNVELQNLEKGFVARTKKKKKKKKENENTQEGSKMKDIVDVGSRGENGSGLGIEKRKREDEEKKIKERKEEKKIKERKEENKAEEMVKKNTKNKRDEIEMKEVGGEVKLDVGQERENKKKKRKSADLDDELKEKFVNSTKTKRKKSKVSDE